MRGLTPIIPQLQPMSHLCTGLYWTVITGLCLVSGHYWSQVHTWPNLWSLYPWSHTALILVAYLVNWAVVLTCVSVCCPAVVGETTVRDSQIMTTLSSHYWITQYTHYHLGLEVFEGLLRFCNLGFKIFPFSVYTGLETYCNSVLNTLVWKNCLLIFTIKLFQILFLNFMVKWFW